jgi:Trypsin
VNKNMSLIATLAAALAAFVGAPAASQLLRARMAMLAAIAALVAVGSAAGETNSRPDGNDHPYVAQFVGDFNPASPGLEAGCSGVLISPTVFLTAAHCIANRPVRQRTQKYVTFDSAWATPGSPTDLHAVATYAWNPLFDGPGFTSKHDIAVFVLAEPVTGIMPARLPTAGLLDELGAHGGLVGQTFESVGYGSQGVEYGGDRPRIVFPPVWERRQTIAGFAALTPDMLHLLTEDAVGYGGNCYGDSGAPHLLAGTDIAVGTASFIDTGCEALSANPRLDTPSARAFLGEYVTLP